MSKKHPLDDIFKRKLRNYEINAPNDLWQKIDAKRSWKQKLQNQFRYYKGGLAIAATLLLSAGIWWLTQATPNYPIGHFHIDPITPKTTKLENPIATVSTQKITLAPTSLNTISNTSKSTADKSTYTLNVSSPATTTAKEELMVETVTDNTEPVVATHAELADATAKGDIIDEKAFGPGFSTMVALPAVAATPLETGLFKTNLRCESFKTGKRHWYAELSTGPSTSLRDPHAREGEFLPYAASRSGTESPKFSFNSELRLSIVSPSGFAFRTGLNYTQLNDQFDYFNENEIKTVITNVYDSDGQIISQDTTYRVGTREKTTLNRYQLIDVPLILGYELNYKDITLAFNAGMYLNLTYSQKGDFLSPIDQKPTSFTSDEIGAYPAYRRQIGLGWYGSIGMYYRMNARTHFYVEPSLRMYTQSATIEEYPLQHKYLLGSLNIGLRRVIF